MLQENTLAFARMMDEADELKAFRQEFIFPQHNGQPVIYFTGNSLGLQPKNMQSAILQHLDDWGTLAVEGHFKGERPWMYYGKAYPQQDRWLFGT